MTQKHLFPFATALFATLSISSAHAFKLVPMEAEFAVDGAKATHTFTIENSQSERIAVEVQMFKRTASPEGKEVREPSDDFNVYPDQLQLEPGEKRNVNVTWIGGPIGDVEKAFRLVATQLPVKLGEQSKQTVGPKVDLRFVIQYVASLYVKKPGQTSNLKVSSIRKQGDKAVVVIENVGSAHQVVRSPSLKLWAEKDKKKVVETVVPSSALVVLASESKSFELDNLLAGDSRRIEVALPKELKAHGSLSGEVVLKEP